MFGGNYFAEEYFAGNSSVTVSPAPPVPTYNTLVVPCTTRSCSTVSGRARASDFDVYSLQSDVTESVVPNIELECTTRNCDTISGVFFNGDLEIYNLQDALIFNGTPISVIVNCPVGYNCPPGVFPHTFDYPPGTFGVPPVTNTGGFPIVLSQAGCQSVVTVVLASDATQAEITAAYDNIFLQLAQQQAQCDAIPLAGPPITPVAHISIPSIEQYQCKDSSVSISITGTFTPYTPPVTYSLNTSLLPPGISASQNTTTLFLTGTPNTIGDYYFTVTAVAAGATGSRDYTLSIAGITTASPLPNADVGHAYSETLAQTGITGTVVWIVTSGSLPTWASLNSSTGEISGTPVSGDEGIIDNFTVMVTNGTTSCSKEFDIETVNTGGIFGNFIWTDIYEIQSPPQSTSSVTALGNTVNIVGTSCKNGSFWYAGCIGTLTYTGPAVNGKLTVTYTPGVAGGSRIIHVTNVVPVITSVNAMAPGDNVFLFTVPAGTTTIKVYGNSLADPYFMAEDNTPAPTCVTWETGTMVIKFEQVP